MNNHDDKPFISGAEARRRISELRRPTSTQEPKVWTKEDLKAGGLPEHFIDIAHWWGSLEELKEDFNL